MRLERLDDMEKYIVEQQHVSLEHLTLHFQVSMNTVRRDINELLKRGKVEKVYGGVIAKASPGALPIEVRSAKNSEAKQHIGKLAASLVNDGDTVFLDSGSTIVCMIPYLARKHKITVMTHSLTVMHQAAQFPSLQLISMGGLYHQDTDSFIGLSTLEALMRITPNKVFVAATGVSLEHGLTNTTYFEVEIKQRVVHSSDKVILCADSSKFDYSSTITFYNFEDLYAIATDRTPRQEYVEECQRHHIQLLCE